MANPGSSDFVDCWGEMDQWVDTLQYMLAGRSTIICANPVQQENPEDNRGAPSLIRAKHCNRG